MTVYLLDTSAWLTHVFDEPGADTVTSLLEEGEASLAISVLSILEVQARFRARGLTEDFGEMLEAYRPLFTRIYPVDEDVVARAIALRESSTGRVPSMDVLIAATAAHHNATLIHRDPHFATLPDEALRQQALSES